MRHRKDTSKKGGWNPEDMERAINEVLKNNMPVRTAAATFSIDRSTLKRRLEIVRKGEPLKTSSYSTSSMKVFTNEEELQLEMYCIEASKMGYGLSTAKLRSLAYEYAVKLDKRFPHTRQGRPNPWLERKEAGLDWQRAFLRRHPDLSIRKPEATSIGRMSAFNKHNVELFYENLRSILVENEYEAHQIWNVDETGITTVQVPEHVIAKKGERQVSSVTSAERGTLVTMCNAVNAGGGSIPPFYVFPRVHFKDIMLKNGSPGCAGTAQQTGWMTESTFREWFSHFMTHAHPSKENRMLLLLDNHETHLSIDFIDIAVENGVVLLTIPPHTSHKLQPLDISIYGPFKRAYNQEIDTWLVSNPGKTVSIYELAELSGKAWLKSAVPANIISGFSAPGIFPFRPDVWQDDDFYLSKVLFVLVLFKFCY